MNNHQSKTEEENKTLHIGFDDTDSTIGRCTTHLAYSLTNTLVNKFQVNFIDFPLLIRLNPNIPLKTRGNGAVCLRIKGKRYDEIKEEAKYFIEEYSDIENGANPGLAFYEENDIANDIISFSNSAMDTVLSKQLAEKTAKKNRIQYHLFGKGHGLVGALAAIGCRLDTDHTYETIAYRKKENIGTIRKIDKAKVKKISDESFPNTFNNFDHRKKRVLIAPHGPDPVFCGIRGEDPLITTKFMENLQIDEDLEGYMAFRSNQGTNLHLTKERRLSRILPFTSGHINCQLIAKPNVINGGHVIFYVKDNFNDILPVAVYEPTRLTKIAASLEIDDKIEIGYGAHIKSNKRTLNLEYLIIKELKEITYFKNPICEKCNKNMKSEGRNKGFQCSICKTKKDNEHKTVIKKDRGLICGGLYVPDPIAHRHLTKPYFRYNKEKKYDRKQILYLLNNMQWTSKKIAGS